MSPPLGRPLRMARTNAVFTGKKKPHGGGSSPPVNTVLPVITGTPQAGSLLAATDGSWANAPTLYSRQWQRSLDGLTGWADIPSATLSTYTPVSSDVGFHLRIRVIASNQTGASLPAYSGATTSVAAAASGGALQMIASPAMGASKHVGQRAAIDNGVWRGTRPVTFSYRWFRNNVPIPGATARTYDIVAADLGTTLSSEITATNVHGSVVVTTGGVTIIGPIAARVRPMIQYITGSVCALPVPGYLAEVSPARFTVGDYDAYLVEGVDNEEIPASVQWLRNGVPIPGATARYYTLTTADIGALIGADVYYENTAGNRHYFSATPLGPILSAVGTPELLAAPSIRSFSGAPVAVGVWSEVVPAEWSWDASHTRLYAHDVEWQWFKDGVAISNANSFSYTPLSTGSYTVRETIQQMLPTGYTFDASGNPKLNVRKSPNILPATYSSTSSAVVATGTVDPELIYKDDLQYLGAFRLPVTAGANPLNWSGGSGLGGGLVCWYNPVGNSGNGSLLVGGRNSNAACYLSEITIPTSLEPNGNTANLNSNPAYRASFVSGLPSPYFFDQAGGNAGNTAIGDGNGVVSGGAFMYGGNIYQNWGALYQGLGTDPVVDPNTKFTHFKKAGTSLSSGTITGPFAFASVAIGDGYSTLPLWYRGPNAAIPTAWQADLGGPMLQGQAQWSNPTPMGYGPALFSFDPADIGSVIPIPNHVLLAYNEFHPIEPWKLGERMSFWIRGASSLSGIAFPTGSRAVLMCSRGNIGVLLYGTPGGFCETTSKLIYNPMGGDKGYHAYPYAPRIFAYDANDLKAVKNQTKQPYEIKPYVSWDLTYPGAPSAEVEHPVGHISMCLDDANKRLFVIERETNRTVGDPIVHVYQLNI